MSRPPSSERERRIDRRELLQGSLGAAALGAIGSSAQARSGDRWRLVDDFARPDSLVAGDGWESLNPGYWRVVEGRLRRRLHNVGDRARSTGFPYHWETHQKKPMPVEYDPSLPYGMIWRRDWRLEGTWSIRAELVVRALRPDVPEGDDPDWRMHRSGYALMGLCFGSRTQLESWSGARKQDRCASMAIWRDDGSFGLFRHTGNPTPLGDAVAVEGIALAPGDRVRIRVDVAKNEEGSYDVIASLESGEHAAVSMARGVEAPSHTDGWFGLVARGLVDFEVVSVDLDPQANRPLDAPANECHVAYALGDTMRVEDGRHRVRFVALFRSGGERAEIRVADRPDPEGGWDSVPAAGVAPVVNNDFRRYTASVDVELPVDPSDSDLYYTVWKDGVDVTADPRIGTDAAGPGTGLVGDVPASGSYVGRLPRLAAPYKLCGLSCHAIHGNSTTLPDAGRFGANWVHDQPRDGAFAHLEAFDFQVMLWEDDVWYLELLLYPPSTDDAYRIVTATLCGPTTRWQMMRHWNVINPGDHDHGMDDVKGPEQLAIRQHGDLGQDPDYMRRNFRIVSHLISGDEDPSPTENPRRWRRWRMPRGDASLVIVDSRLWRSSQDTAIWGDQGWGHHESLYTRSDPTRSLLGEAQFAWLQEVLRTDPAPLICLSGINGLHTVWKGNRWSRGEGGAAEFHERDRVAADYAGWVKAGVDRVLELLGGRDGVVSVYGDVHVGSIFRNVEHGVFECSFGPIGRHGGRTPIEGFGPRMRDIDGREVEAIALYHQKYGSPALGEREGPRYWNFLEIELDPSGDQPAIGLAVRNIVDAPDGPVRGGARVRAGLSETGRALDCRLPEVVLLPGAEVLVARADGRPVRGARCGPDGRLALRGLVGVEPGEEVVLTARAGGEGAAQVVRTLPPS